MFLISWSTIKSEEKNKYECKRILARMESMDFDSVSFIGPSWIRLDHSYRAISEPVTNKVARLGTGKLFSALVESVKKSVIFIVSFVKGIFLGYGNITAVKESM